MLLSSTGDSDGDIGIGIGGKAFAEHEGVDLDWQAKGDRMDVGDELEGALRTSISQGMPFLKESSSLGEGRTDSSDSTATVTKSRPSLQNVTRSTLASHRQEGWDWDSFLEAYRNGRWDR